MVKIVIDENKETVAEEVTEETVDMETETTVDEKEDKKKKKKKMSKEAIEIESLKEELQKQKDTYMRILAEYDNFRKRSAAEKTAVYNNAVSDAVNAILPVADNINRALSQENSSAEDLKKGVEMICNQFNQSFEKLGITAVGEIGESFNPDIHNAVSHIDSEDFEENVVCEVFQKGYKLNDKIVRHAMVQVAN